MYRRSDITTGAGSLLAAENPSIKFNAYNFYFILYRKHTRITPAGEASALEP